MPPIRTKLRFFVSSPSDVTSERARVSTVVDGLRQDFADEYEFEVIRHEENVYFANEGTFQNQIVSPTVCDLVICILWSRLGTPLPDRYQRSDGTHPTGTEYEFETAMNWAAGHQKPDVLVYLKTAPVITQRGRIDQQSTALGEADLQYEMLKAFWSKWMRDERGYYTGSYHEFLNADDFESKLEQHTRAWLTGLRSAAASWTKGSPYRGLEVFEEEHEQIFFGRTRAVAEMRARLTAMAKQPGRVAFLLVLGISGSGKSSVVRAGLVPELRKRGRVPGVGAWRRCIVRPSELGTDVLVGLAKAMFHDLPELQEGDYSQPDDLVSSLWRALPNQEARPVVRALDRSPRGIQHRAGQNGLPVTNLLIVIDQLEEFFRWDGPAQSEFVRVVNSLAKSGRVWVVATLRNDFYPQLAASPELRALKDAGAQYDLLPLGEIELADIIRRPAQAAGLSFGITEDGQKLDDRILDAAKTQLDSLPLLEFTLEQLYRNRNVERQELTFAAYEAMGGLEGAIASQAESLLQGLRSSGSVGDVADAAFGRVFHRLATVAEDGRVIRNWTALQDFERDAGEMALVTAFVEARLLVLDHRATVAGSESPAVRVAHEALLQRWPRVADWVKANAGFLLWRERLRPALATWKRLAAGGKDPSGGLLRGDLLAEAERWTREMTGFLSDDETRFIEQSTAEKAGQEQAEREAREALQKAHRRTTRQLSRFLVAAATRDLGTAPIRSLLLSVEALKRSVNEETERTLREVLMTVTGFPLAGHRHYVRSIAFHPNSRSLASGSEDGSVCLWDLEDPKPQPQVLRKDVGPIHVVTFNHDGSLLAWGSTDSSVHVRKLDDGTGLILERIYAPRNIYAIAFDSTGRSIAAGGDDHTVYLWDLTQSRRRPRHLDGHTGDITSLAFEPSGRYLASASRDKTVRVWDLTNLDAQPQILTSHARAVNGVAFSRAGRHLASVGADELVLLWDLSQLGKEPRSLHGHHGIVHSAAFDTKGRFLATAGEDKTVRLWNLDSGEHRVLRGHERAVLCVVLDQDGHRLASGGADGTIRLQTLSIRHDEPKRLQLPDRATSLAIDQQGRYIAAGGNYGRLRLWDLLRPEAEALAIEGHGFGRVCTLGFDPTGRFLVSVDDAGKVHLSPLQAIGAKPRELHHFARFAVVAFDPTGHLLAFTGDLEVIDSQILNTIWLLNLNDADAVPRPLGRIEGWITLLAFDPTATALVSKSRDDTVRLWDLSNLDSEPRVFRGHTSFALDLSWRYFASIAKDQSVRLWRSPNLNAEATVLCGPTGYVNNLAFDSRGRYLASVDADETVCLWDLSRLDSGAKRLIGNRGRVGARIAFDAHGRYLASARDKTILLWDLQKPEDEPRVLAFKASVEKFCFHPSAPSLVTADADGEICIATVAIDELCRLAGEAAGRNLTRAEWHESFGDEPYRKTCPDLPEPNDK
jgi:WD40 repeat protein